MNWTSTFARSHFYAGLLLLLSGGLLPRPTRAQSVPAEQGLVADTTELRVLRQLYHATNGGNWSNNANWLQGTTLAAAATWAGVVVGNGDVVALNLNYTLAGGQLPPDLGALRALQTLNVSHNQLTGPLPASLGQCASLLVLNAQYNQLSGGVPAALGNTGLQYLYLDHNRFTDLPAGLGALRLNQFFADANQLTGPFPAWLTAQTDLAYLGLGANRFAGPLPAAIGQLRGLQGLYLNGNQFSGPLPAELGQLTALSQLYLNDNPWQGAVPAALGQLSALTDLGLNGTPLGGAVPAALAQLPQLTYLYLSSNAFTGLPSWVGAPRVPTDFYVHDNALDFAALEANSTGPGQPLPTLYYAPQRSPAGVDQVTFVTGGLLQLVRAPQGAHNAYQWEHQAGGQWQDVAGQTRATLRISAAPASAAGEYRLRITNAWVPHLVLYAKAFSVRALAPPTPLTPPALLNPPVDGCAPALANAAPPVRTGADPVNFVRTWVPRVALTDSAAVRRGNKKDVQVKTEYLDGLGRPVQTVLRQESPGGHDLVQPVAYDALGREPRQYAPYAAANPGANAGAYRPNAVREQYDFYRQDPAVTPAGPGNLSDGVTPTGVAYSETAFEASPLNRVLAQAAHGEAWALTPTGGHAVRRGERPNTLADAVPRLVPGYDPAPNAVAYAGDYPAGALWVTESTDENGNRSQSFADQQGQVVAKRVENPGPGRAGVTAWLSTYYAYDDFPRLRAVFPPRAVALLQAPSATPWTITSAADSLLFRYRYDGRGRVIAKQVPGTGGETWVVYDQLDRPVLSQDAVQRARDAWAYTKYDALGRPVLTGYVNRVGSTSREALQAEADQTPDQWEEPNTDAATQYYSTTRAFPRLDQPAFTAVQVLTATYYDDYNFDHDPAGTADAAYDGQSNGRFTTGPAPVADARTTGQVTRTRTRVLGMPATDPRAWLTATTFYDERGRAVQVHSTNALGGRDLLTSQVDFAGRVRQTVAVHHSPTLPAAGVQTVETTDYDDAGRLLATAQQVDGEAAAVPVAAVRYNELGQLTRKTLGSGALTQQVDYRYNARGWLTHLNDADAPVAGDLFNLTLRYECGFAVPQFNGNLAGQLWRGRDGVERAYGYLYDGANRLVQGDYVARAGGAGSTTGPWAAEVQHYNMNNVRYDENGNLRSLSRWGLLAPATRVTPKLYGPVDALSYAYAGNRLQAVNDAVTTNELPRLAGYHGAPASLAGDFQEQGVRHAAEYTYDANGNLTQDRNKGITGIVYNYLNLPRQIHFGAGADSLVFRYTASGQKVTKLVYQSGLPVLRTDYVGSYQYEQDSLRFFPHTEGRVLRFVSGTSGQVRHEREFTVKDHLGNLRLAYRLGHDLRYVARLEPEEAERETRQFDAASVSAPVAQNVGPLVARTGRYVARLNAGGSAPQPLGPLKQLGVQKGDIVSIAAPGYYPRAVQSSNFAFSLASFVLGLLPPPTGAPAPPDGQRKSLPLLSIGVSSALPALVHVSGGVPKGYVRLLVFDADSNLVSSQTQTQQLSALASGGYEDLRLEVAVAQDGYVTAYVGNESDADVYFDDVAVEHRQGLQVQENQYDPVGLDLAGLPGTTPGLKPLNQYKFNGKENQLDLGLNWSDYGARFNDPQVGRWHSLDPLAEKFSSYSPYNLGLNNSLRFVDPDGAAPIDITLLGANNSSVTVKTDLVDLRINASGLGIDFGGNYTLSGSDVLQAAVDIGGVFDPTPTLDILGASMSANNGDYWGAAASGLGAAIPYAGDLAKTGKVTNGIRKIESALEAEKLGLKIEDKVATSSRAARREAMRDSGIPTSQQPLSQSKNASGREYTYEVTKNGGGKHAKSVQQQTLDSSHPGQNHWEAGKVRVDADGNVKVNSYGRSRLDNDKSKVNY